MTITHVRFEAQGSDNLFTTARLKKMREVEQMITGKADYTSHYCMYEYNDDLTGFNCSKGACPA